MTVKTAESLFTPCKIPMKEGGQVEKGRKYHINRNYNNSCGAFVYGACDEIVFPSGDESGADGFYGT